MFNYSEPQNISSLINFLKVSKGGNVFSSVIEPTLACPLCLQVPSALPLMAPVASCFFSGIGVVGDGDAIHLVSIFQHPIRSCSNSREGHPVLLVTRVIYQATLKTPGRELYAISSGPALQSRKLSTCLFGSLAGSVDTLDPKGPGSPPPTMVTGYKTLFCPHILP